MKIKQFIRTQRNRQLSRYLENVNPVKLNAVAAGKLIKAFRNAARKVPAYKAILKNNGINSSEITDLKTFVENVPVITKNDTFSTNVFRSVISEEFIPLFLRIAL